MNPVRNALFACMLVAVGASAADTSLLNYVMGDAKIISGIHVQSARQSKFGLYVLSQMQSDDPAFQKFVAETQFDPRTDLSEMIVATGGTAENPAFLIAARGRFNPSAIMTAARDAGGTTVSTGAGGAVILTRAMDNSKTGAMAFLPDGSTALMGTLSAVQDALGRTAAPLTLSGDVVTRIGKLSLTNDAWFLSTGPVSDFFAGKIADPNLGGAMGGSLMQAVQQASGGIKFNPDSVIISGEAQARSDKDAQALADVVRFIAGLVKLNAGNDANAQKAASLVDSLAVSATGSTMQLSLPIPEDMMEQLFMPVAAPRPARTNLHKRASAR